MDEPLQSDKQRRLLYAVIALGVIVVGGFAAWSLSSGGLPGTKDSPSATVHGRSTTGQTAAD